MKRATRNSTVGFPTPAELPKADKAKRGRTSAEATPLAIQSKVEIDEVIRDEMRSRFARKFVRRAGAIERATIRLVDINGPKGGIDIACRIKIVIRGRPSVVVEELGAAPLEAFALAINAASEALRHALERGEGMERRVRHAATIRARGLDQEVEIPAVLSALPEREASRARRPSKKLRRGAAGERATG